MAKVFFWIIVVPFAAAIIVFSVNNQTEVRLDLWPLDVVTVPLPVFLIVLVSLVVGFFAGGMIAWGSAGRTRSPARRSGRTGPHHRPEPHRPIVVRGRRHRPHHPDIAARGLRPPAGIFGGLRL